MTNLLNMQEKRIFLRIREDESYFKFRILMNLYFFGFKIKHRKIERSWHQFKFKIFDLTAWAQMMKDPQILDMIESDFKLEFTNFPVQNRQVGAALMPAEQKKLCDQEVD